ncbi:hypothetical protein PSHT_10673 [Puccinia striiformis]|uniref:Uncharacterized protein n=1 Tax=Puccinia striiformis TaxID=27350 RepID=A0A2S4V809_9BASI|nr:hypothetical protein PSHT_10673 [Puccinia striiformis]
MKDTYTSKPAVEFFIPPPPNSSVTVLSPLPPSAFNRNNGSHKTFSSMHEVSGGSSSPPHQPPTPSIPTSSSLNVAPLTSSHPSASWTSSQAPLPLPDAPVAPLPATQDPTSYRWGSLKSYPSHLFED